MRYDDSACTNAISDNEVWNNTREMPFGDICTTYLQGSPVSFKCITEGEVRVMWYSDQNCVTPWITDVVYNGRCSYLQASETFAIVHFDGNCTKSSSTSLTFTSKLKLIQSLSIKYRI